MSKATENKGLNGDRALFIRATLSAEKGGPAKFSGVYRQTIDRETGIINEGEETRDLDREKTEEQVLNGVPLFVVRYGVGATGTRFAGQNIITEKELAYWKANKLQILGPKKEPKAKKEKTATKAPAKPSAPVKKIIAAKKAEAAKPVAKASAKPAPKAPVKTSATAPKKARG